MVHDEQIKNQARMKSPARVKTTMIVEKLKLQRFQALFRRLDHDCDGYISSQRIDISTLSPELLEIMTPLFCELEELGKTGENGESPSSPTLDIDEFVDALGRLYDQVPHPQKHTIIQECASDLVKTPTKTGGQNSARGGKSASKEKWTNFTFKV